MNDNFENLEKRCQKLRIKKMAILVFGGVLAIICIALIYKVMSIMPQKQDIDDYVVVLEDKKIENKPIVIDKKYQSKGFEEVSEEKVIKYEEVKKSEIKDNESSLKLKTNVDLEEIEKSYPNIDKKEKIKQPSTPVKKRELSKIPPPKEVKIVEPTTEKEHIEFQIKEIKNVSQMQKQFRIKPSYAIAIKLAKIYLSQNELQNAVEWSLKASKLDKDMVAPWISYSKAKFRLGNEETAIRVLEMLLKKKNSPEVQKQLIRFKEKMGKK